MNTCQNEWLSMITSNSGVVKISKVDSNGVWSHETFDLSRDPTNAAENRQVINPIIYNNFISREQQIEDDHANNEMERHDYEMMKLLREEEEIMREQEKEEIDEMFQLLEEEDKQRQERENQEEIDAMFQQLEQEEENNKKIENECPICIEKINITNNCVTPCGHTFCLTCILISYTMYKTCPLCRSKLIPEMESEIPYENNEEPYNNMSVEEWEDQAGERERRIMEWQTIEDEINERIREEEEANSYERMREWQEMEDEREERRRHRI